MLIDLMRMIGLFYYCTWFIWPFVFMYSFINAISSTVKNGKLSLVSSTVAAISLLIILAGVVTPIFN